MAIYQNRNETAPPASQEVPKAVLLVLTEAGVKDGRILSAPTVIGPDIKKWNSDLMAIAGSKQALLNQLHSVLRDESNDIRLRRAAAFFYGMNIDADVQFCDLLAKNPSQYLIKSGKQTMIVTSEAQRFLRQIYFFDSGIVSDCTNAISLMLKQKLYSLPPAGFTVAKAPSEAFPNTYESDLTPNKEVQLGISPEPLRARNPIDFFRMPFPERVQTVLKSFPVSLNLGSQTSYDFTGTYLQPIVSLLGGTITPNESNGTNVINLGAAYFVSDAVLKDFFKARASEYLDQKLSTPSGQKTVRDLIEFGDLGKTQLAAGKTMKDAITALENGAVQDFIACLDPNSTLFHALNGATGGKATYKDITLSADLAQLLARQIHSYSGTVEGYVPIGVFDLYVYYDFTNKLFSTTLPPSTISGESQQGTFDLNTHTVGARLLTSVHNVRLKGKFLAGASASWTNSGTLSKEKLNQSVELAVDLGTGVEYTPVKFGGVMKGAISLGFDAIGRINMGTHAPEYNLQVVPNVNLDIGKTRFTVYTGIFLPNLGVQNQANWQNYSTAGMSAEWRTKTPGLKPLQNIGVKVDAYSAYKDLEKLGAGKLNVAVTFTVGL